MVAFAQVSVARDARTLFPCLTYAGFETQRVSFDPGPPFVLFKDFCGAKVTAVAGAM